MLFMSMYARFCTWSDMIRVSHFNSQKFWFRKSGAGICCIGGVEASVYMNFLYSCLSRV
jgi:hypothetical protein